MKGMASFEQKHPLVWISLYFHLLDIPSTICNTIPTISVAACAAPTDKRTNGLSNSNFELQL